MADFIKRNFGALLLAGLGVWLYQQTKKGADVVAKPIGSMLAEIQFKLNGSDYIKYPKAGFYLDDTKLNDDYTVRDKVWLKAMYLAHDKHADYIEQIFDPYLRLKPLYIPLIGLEVNDATIATAAKG